MDFMKVFDQTVREIKREVNLKVLKVPEIEQKVLDATDDEPWGPHGTVLAEIAQGTKKYSECQMIMNVLWTRLEETGKNWRVVYKALAVIEYLVARGSERAVDDIVEHTYQISSLSSFEYVEPSGKDVGLNVRKKSETIVALLNNKDKIQEARDKAAANRDKYIGLSSSELASKSGAASFSNSNFRSSSDRYRGSGNTSNDSYKGKGRYGDVKTTRSKREPSHYGSKEHDSPVSGASKKSTNTNTSQKAPPSKYDEYSDDFDPRGISSAKPSAGSGQGDLVAENFFDLLDAPESLPTANSTASEVDLFADAAFVSTMPQPDSSKLLAPQTNVDLFASGTIDLFADPCPLPELDNNASKPDISSNTFDPFAAIPMSNFDGLDPLGGHNDPFPIASDQNLPHAKTNESLVETKSPPKKEAFQVKSGVWADTLSRGLIDLNITAPKKVNLADIGIVGGLSDGSESINHGGHLPSFNMGIAMGHGSGVSKSELPTSKSSPPTDDNDFFSSLTSNHQHHT